MDKHLFKSLKYKKIFTSDAVYTIRLLLALLCISVCALPVSGYLYGVITGDTAMLLLLITGIMTAAANLFITKHLIAPYKRCRTLFKKFVKDEIYSELLNSEYLIFNEQQSVLQHFDSLLDQKSKISLSTKQAELLALQNQINPHFLYNTLEAIRSDALFAGIDSIANTTEALATFFRYTIADVGTLVTVEDELDNIDNYFKIQQYRFSGKFTMNISYKRADVLNLKLPKLTLQPFIENAIFHGLESKSDGGDIDINFEMTDINLYISIKDNGVGIPEEKLNKLNYSLEHVSISCDAEKSESKGGIALNNIARRIKLLFGEDYGFHIYSISGLGTDVRIKIPAIY